MRKGDGADGQRAKVMENFTTNGEGEEYLGSVPFLLCHSVLHTWVIEGSVSVVYISLSNLIHTLYFRTHINRHN